MGRVGHRGRGAGTLDRDIGPGHGYRKRDWDTKHETEHYARDMEFGTQQTGHDTSTIDARHDRGTSCIIQNLSDVRPFVE